VFCSFLDQVEINRFFAKKIKKIKIKVQDMCEISLKQCKKKSGRESFFERRAAGGRTGGLDRRYKSYFYILQAPAEYKSDLATSVPTLSPIRNCPSLF
jgi:hypothetical protein